MSVQLWQELKLILVRLIALGGGLVVAYGFYVLMPHMREGLQELFGTPPSR